MTRFLSGVIFLAALHPAGAQDGLDLTPVKKWITAQKDLRSIEADFIQSRSLKTVRNPLTSPGKLWVTSDGEMRWEVGNPPKTIFLRHKASCFLIQPAKQEYTQITSLNASDANTQKIPVLEFPIAPSFLEFTKRFSVSQITSENNLCTVDLLPRDTQSQKYLKNIRICFSQDSGVLRYFEVVAMEGSSIKNEFSNVRVNKKIDAAVFNVDLNGYRTKNFK